MGQVCDQLILIDSQSERIKPTAKLARIPTCQIVQVLQEVERENDEACQLAYSCEKLWISRSNKRHWYAESERFSGIVFGQGSFLSARLYDKTLQIKKSKQDYLRELWWMEGWDRESPVWRLEFQIRRAVLMELGISSYDDLKDRSRL